jgi:hypothetical protein
VDEWIRVKPDMHGSQKIGGGKDLPREYNCEL